MYFYQKNRNVCIVSETRVDNVFVNNRKSLVLEYLKAKVQDKKHSLAINLLSPGSTFSGKELSTFVAINHNNFQVGSFYFYELLSRKEHLLFKKSTFFKSASFILSSFSSNTKNLRIFFKQLFLKSHNNHFTLRRKVSKRVSILRT